MPKTPLFIRKMKSVNDVHSKCLSAFFAYGSSDMYRSGQYFFIKTDVHIGMHQKNGESR